MLKAELKLYLTMRNHVSIGRNTFSLRLKDPIGRHARDPFAEKKKA